MWLGNTEKVRNGEGGRLKDDSLSGQNVVVCGDKGHFT